MNIQDLGQRPYTDVYAAMQTFTETRTPATEDEIWLCEHPPVFTLGWHGDPAHILNAQAIPVVACDRGGQVTYHGPGQLLAYFLIDLRRRRQGVAAFVVEIEQLLIRLLRHFQIEGHVRPKMPGVYVENKKIASIGLRVKNGQTYHGLALNVDMDLQPFSFINPCGYEGLEVTRMRDWALCDVMEVRRALREILVGSLMG